MQTVFAGLPGQVEGVDWYAVTAEARARVVGSEAERLGGCGVYNFEDVDAHAVGDDFHFVDQADVDGAVDVFQQLGHFRGFGRADLYHLVNGLLIQSNTNFEAGRGMAADDFRDSACFEVGVARVFALWRVDQENVLADS
ncbi:hypothetical protein D3C81_1630600 [compost metagenome]